MKSTEPEMTTLPLWKRVSWSATLEWVLVAAALFIHAVLMKPRVWSDGRIRYETMLLLVEEGKISGEVYSILQSILAIPFYWAGERFGWGGETSVAHFNLVIVSVSLAAFYTLLAGTISPTILRRTVLIVLSASMFGRHMQSFYGEPFTACAALLGIAALVTNRPVLAGIMMTLGVVNTPAMAVGLALCNFAWALRTRRWVHATWPLVTSVALIMLEFWVRRGSPFVSGYEGDAGRRTILGTTHFPGFSYPFLFGLLGLTISFGKGIVFYAPGLLLHYAGYPSRSPATREFARLSMAFAWGVLLVYARWSSWHGGWFWGPRFLLFACIPASFALAVHLSELHPSLFTRGLLIVALAFSGWVGINGAVFDQNGMTWCLKNNRYEPICWFTPEWSALFRPFLVEKKLNTKHYVLIGHAVAVVCVLSAPRIVPLFRDLWQKGLAALAGRES